MYSWSSHLASIHADRGAPGRLQEPAALHQEAVADTNSPAVDLSLGDVCVVTTATIRPSENESKS